MKQAIVRPRLLLINVTADIQYQLQFYFIINISELR